jgi:hypothetical protein
MFTCINDEYVNKSKMKNLYDVRLIGFSMIYEKNKDEIQKKEYCNLFVKKITTFMKKYQLFIFTREELFVALQLQQIKKLYDHEILDMVTNITTKGFQYKKLYKPFIYLSKIPLLFDFAIFMQFMIENNQDVSYKTIVESCYKNIYDILLVCIDHERISVKNKFLNIIGYIDIY